MGKRGRRRPGILATVGLVVEGDTEFAALPLLHRRRLIAGCPPLKATNLGGVGSHKTPAAIANQVAPHVIAHQVAGRPRVVVCVDREQRHDCSPSFARAIHGELVKVYVAKDRPVTALATVSVVVADRAFEAWLLAGSGQTFDGQLGRKQRKGVVELEALLRRPYRKTVDGPQLFSKLDLQVARRGSKSLDKLLRELGV